MSEWVKMNNELNTDLEMQFSLDLQLGAEQEMEPVVVIY
jgi:hypothetical protein